MVGKGKGKGKGKEAMPPHEPVQKNGYTTVPGEEWFEKMPSLTLDEETHHIICCSYQSKKEKPKPRYWVHLGAEWLMISIYEKDGVPLALMTYYKEPFATSQQLVVKKNNLTYFRALYDNIEEKDLRALANKILEGQITEYYEGIDHCGCELDLVTENPVQALTGKKEQASTPISSRKRKPIVSSELAEKRARIEDFKRTLESKSSPAGLPADSDGDAEEESGLFVTESEEDNNPNHPSFPPENLNPLWLRSKAKGSISNHQGITSGSESGFSLSKRPFSQLKGVDPPLITKKGTTSDGSRAEPSRLPLRPLAKPKHIQNDQELTDECDPYAFIFVLPKGFPDDAATHDLMLINRYCHLNERLAQIMTKGYTDFLKDVSAAIHRAYSANGSGEPMSVNQLRGAKLRAGSQGDPMQDNEFITYYTEHEDDFKGWDDIIEKALENSANLARQKDANVQISEEGMHEIERSMRVNGASEEHIEWMKVYLNIKWTAASNEVDGFEGDKGEYENMNVQIRDPA